MSTTSQKNSISWPTYKDPTVFWYVPNYDGPIAVSSEDTKNLILAATNVNENSTIQQVSTGILNNMEAQNVLNTYITLGYGDREAKKILLAIQKQGEGTRPSDHGRSIDREAEFDYLLGYVAQSCFNEEICRDRLRMLRTAYCLHHNLDVDTADYDNDLLELWNGLEETGDDSAVWGGYDGFDLFMCEYLV